MNKTVRFYDYSDFQKPNDPVHIVEVPFQDWLEVSREEAKAAHAAGTPILFEIYTLFQNHDGDYRFGREEVWAYSGPVERVKGAQANYERLGNRTTGVYQDANAKRYFPGVEAEAEWNAYQERNASHASTAQ